MLKLLMLACLLATLVCIDAKPHLVAPLSYAAPSVAVAAPSFGYAAVGGGAYYAAPYYGAYAAAPYYASYPYAGAYWLRR